MHYIKIYTREDIKFIYKFAEFDYLKTPIYFKFPKEVKESLTDRLDPFIHILSFPMMLKGGDFIIHGACSKSLLKTFINFNNIWTIWKPDLYKKVNLITDLIDDIYRPDNNKMITTFSGGLDATYTTYKYSLQKNEGKKYIVDKSIMIHGADIPLKYKKDYEIVFDKAQSVLKELDIKLIPIETNFREIFNTNWSFSFGSVICGTLEFFMNEYFTGAASDDSVHAFQVPWGMNPISDQFLTSDSFRFISDGIEHSRTDRANFIKTWSKGIENLRVCWSNQDHTKNCGKCEKCVRTMLNFMAVGRPIDSAFPTPFDPKLLDQENIIKVKHNIIYFREIYEYGMRNKTLSKELLDLLKNKIDLWEKTFK